MIANLAAVFANDHYRYTKEPKEMWKDILADLTELETAQLSKLKSEGLDTHVKMGVWRRRIDWFQRDPYGVSVMFTKPPGWKHVDDLLPDMIRDWWNHKNRKSNRFRDSGYATKDPISTVHGLHRLLDESSRTHDEQGMRRQMW